MIQKINARILLTMVLVLGIMLQSITTVSAAGNETWNLGSRTVGSMTVTDNTYTYVKTMGATANLNIWINFSRADSSSYPPIKVTMKVFDADSGALITYMVVNEEQGNQKSQLGLTVRNGQRLKLFFDVSSQYNPPGAYRKANITYGYNMWQ